MNRWKIAYFDDDVNQIECIQDILEDTFNVEGTTDASKVDELLKVNPDLILIDVHMPNISGYELYYKIQVSPFYNHCPVMFISGDTSPESALKGHQIGADDFLPRNLNFNELHARLINKINLHKRSSLKLSIENLSLDVEMFCVYVNDEMINLTLNELKILGIIVRSYPQLCHRDHIMQKVWGDDSVKPGTISAHLSVLNSKLKDWKFELKLKRDQVLVVPR